MSILFKASFAVVCVLHLGLRGTVQGHEGHDHTESMAAPISPSSAPSTSLTNFSNPLEAVFATPSLSYLQYAILVSGLEGNFVASDTSYTILAPSNNAWDRTNGEDLLRSQRLGGILSFHIIPNALTTAEIRNGSILMTLWGLTLSVSRSGNNLTFSGATNNATIIVPDIRAGNNVIHIVDNLLDRRNNAAISSPEAKATFAKINYDTMLQYPARSPSSSPPVVTAAG